MALFQPLRETVREIGKRLLAAHILEDREDIFYLALPEISAFLFGRWDGQGAKLLVADRKEQYRAWLNETPEDVLTDNGEDGPGRILCG